MSTPASMVAAKPASAGIAPGRAVVDHPSHEVGVAADPAQPREVLDRRGDPGAVHPGHESRGLGGHRTRRRPVAAAEQADRGVGRSQVGRHHVGHRGEVGVDADRGQLATPARRVRGQLRIGLLGLALRARDGVEAPALEPLHLATLLVDREQRLDPFRPAGRGPDVAHHPAGRGGPEGGVAQQDHAARPGTRQGPRLRRAQTAGVDADHHQLADLLAQAHRVDQVGAGQWIRRRRGRRSRARRGRGAGRGRGRPGRGRRRAQRRGRAAGAR